MTTEQFDAAHFNRIRWAYNNYHIRAFNVCEAFEDRLDFWYHVWLANTKVMQIENDVVTVQFILVGNSDIPICYVRFPIDLMNADFSPLEWKVCGPKREECGDVVYTISKKDTEED